MKTKINKCLNDSYEGYGDFSCNKAVGLLEELFKDEMLSFISFLRENYHSDTEAWSFNKLPLGFYQDKITYDIISVEEIFNIFIEKYKA